MGWMVDRREQFSNRRHLDEDNLKMCYSLWYISSRYGANRWPNNILCTKRTATEDSGSASTGGVWQGWCLARMKLQLVWRFCKENSQSESQSEFGALD